MKKTQKELNTIKVEDAPGCVLMHDITKVVPGKYKGPAFRKGHVIKKSDVPLLKDLGKERVYAFDIPPSCCHEDEAAEEFKSLAGENIRAEGPSEGKVLFLAAVKGLLRVNKRAVDKINAIGDIALTTVHSDIPVDEGDKVAGIRALPLVIEKEKVRRALEETSGPVLEVLPFKKKKAALVVTGEEIASGRIKDAFRPVIEKKLSGYESSLSYFSTPGDDEEKIKKSVREAFRQGCDLIIVSGGMSVDPDDVSGKAIESAGVDIVSFGAPVLPGNMLLIAYIKETAVLGVPACALHSDITALDIFLPYVFAGKKIEKEDVLRRGCGGLCRKCETCIFPRCALGK